MNDTIMINRRAFVLGMSGATLAIGAAGLAGCASSTVATVSADVLADVSLVSNGLTALLSYAGASVGLTPALIAQIGSYVADAKAAAAAIVPGVAAAVAAPSVQTIGTAVSNIVSVVSGYPVSAEVSTILADVQTLLPVIEVAVGIVVAAAVAPSGRTPATARTELAGLIAGAKPVGVSHKR